MAPEIATRPTAVLRTATTEFGDLYGEHLPPLLRFAFLLCGHQQQAEDAVAETFVKVLPEWERGRVTQPAAYLRRTATVAYDPTTEAWRSLPKVPRPYIGNWWMPSAVAVGRKMVVFGTADQTQRPPCARRRHRDLDSGPPTAGPELLDENETPGRLSVPLVSTAEAVLVWGGGVARSDKPDAASCCRAVGDGAVFTPGS